MRGDQKVLQFDMTHKWHKQFFMLVFNINALNSNAHVTSVKKLFDISQIEFLLHVLQVRFGGLIDLAIIIEPCSCCISCCIAVLKDIGLE